MKTLIDLADAQAESLLGAHAILLVLSLGGSNLLISNANFSISFIFYAPIYTMQVKLLLKHLQLLVNQVSMLFEINS